MKFHPSNIFITTFSCTLLFLTASCNKDSDLLAEYVVENPQAFMVNDIVVTLANKPIVIAPLSNDTFDEPEKVTITEVTPPKLGTAEVLEDNTVVYTPNTDETGTDEFDYTTSVTNPDNTVSTETGNITVTVTPTEKTPTDPNAVNFSKYGAVGDGKKDDTKAIQAALDAEESLVADEGATFLISSKLDIDQKFEHTIDWNGATIITTAKLSPMIKVDKRSSNGGLTTMTNLNINGNGVAQRGIECNSIVNLSNFEVDSFLQSTTASPAGVYIHVYNDADCYGDWIFDNVNVSDVRGADNGVTTDSWGAANGYLIYWVQVPSSPTKLIVKNGEVHDCWGEDAQAIGTFSSGIDISFSNGSMEFTNMNLYDWERRCAKNFTGNTTWTNCTFTDPSPSNPNLSSKNKSGMVVFGMGSGAKGGDNTVFNNCNFVGKGYDGRVIGLQNDKVEFNNCTFSGGARLAFTMAIGDVTICNNVFESGSSIYDYNISASKYTGQILIGTNNSGSSNYIDLDSSKWSSTNCN